MSDIRGGPGRQVTDEAAHWDALEAFGAGPHPEIQKVYCAACSKYVGVILDTPTGVLLVAEWDNRASVDVSLLERETTPFEWRCTRDGPDLVDRSLVRDQLAAGKKINIHRGHSARR